MQFKFSGTPVTVIGNNSPERPDCNCNLFFSFFFLFFFLLLFLSLSFLLHAQRRDEPDNWLHASRDPLNQERAINLSIYHCFVTSWEVFTCWVKQIKPQAPLLVVPIRECLIFMFNVLSALLGIRRPNVQLNTCGVFVRWRIFPTHATFLWHLTCTPHRQLSTFKWKWPHRTHT